MVEVQFVRGATERTLSAISFPYFELYGGGNQSSALGIHARGLLKVFLAFYGDELELAHDAKIILFKPGINQMEYAVVRPNARFDFLVYTDSLG